MYHPEQSPMPPYHQHRQHLIQHHGLWLNILIIVHLYVYVGKYVLCKTAKSSWWELVGSTLPALVPRCLTPPSSPPPPKLFVTILSLNLGLILSPLRLLLNYYTHKIQKNKHNPLEFLKYSSHPQLISAIWNIWYKCMCFYQQFVNNSMNMHFYWFFYNCR